MIIDRTHIRWGVGTAVASVAVSLVYLANNDPALLQKWHIALPLPAWIGPVPPLRDNVGATPLGLVYGTVALLIFLFAALLGWRRNHSSVPVGPIQTWLKAHIWLTLFTVPLVLFHCGFHGGGPMTQFLLALYSFVMISGLWGLALQQVVPKLMREYLSEEVIFEEIPFIRGQLVAQAEQIREELATQPEGPTPRAAGGAATATAGHALALKATLDFVDKEALPYLRTIKTTRQFRLRDKRSSDDQFRLMQLQVPADIHPLLAQLQDRCDEKRRIDLQARLHYWLHGWILVHAPASLLLVVLTLAHAIVATFFYA